MQHRPMMDPFSFQDDLVCDELSWPFSPEPFNLIPSAAPPALRRSSFAPYTGPHGAPSLEPAGACNIHRRVIGMLRRIPKVRTESSRAGEESRGFRHMMKERERREKLSQSYADLYSMLSSRSKADKNSIVRSAAVYVRELKGANEELRRRNEELKARIEKDKGKEMKIRVVNPSSAIDSLMGALRFLKRMDVKAAAIRSEFDHQHQELSAVLNVEVSEVSASELERSGSLVEVELQSLEPCPRSNDWSGSCHVETALGSSSNNHRWL